MNSKAVSCVGCWVKKAGKTHVCFPKRSLYRQAMALEAVLARPILTLAMPTTIALPASLLVHHRVTAAFWTQVPGHVQLARL